MRDGPATLSSLILVGVDLWAVGAEVQLDRWERLRGIVAEQADIHLSPLDKLLGEHRLSKLVVDDLRRVAELRFVLDDLETERDGLVLRLDDERVGHLRNQ